MYKVVIVALISIIFCSNAYAENTPSVPHYLLRVIHNIQKQVNKINQEYESKNATIDSSNSIVHSTIISKTVNFQNTTKVYTDNINQFLENIDLLNKMGYLPFKPIEFNNKTNEVAWEWDSKFIPQQLAALTPKSNTNILYLGALKHFFIENHLGHNISNIDTTHLLKEVYDNGNFKPKKPFIWVLVSQTQPERLKAWQNGQWVLETNVNTGLYHTTPNGNSLIYARYRYFTMSGVFPKTHEYYYDPNVAYVNFFDGNKAIHGLYRYSYGYPQSAGCVELPIDNAKRLYKMLYVGAVVTIEP